jgi:hypothetical protein
VAAGSAEIVDPLADNLAVDRNEQLHIVGA